MPLLRRRHAPWLLAAVVALSAGQGMAEEVPAMLSSMPGMQLIAAVDAMHAGDLTKAEALFTLAIQQKKLAADGMVHAYFNRGLVRQRLGNLRAAIEDFTIALQSDALSTEGRVEAYYNRGLAWRKLGALQKAMDDFSRAIELQPRFAPAYYSRALGLTANGNYLLALVDLDKALRYGFAQRHKIFYSKAMIHLARAERNLAIAELRKALKVKPGFKAAKQRLAMLRSERGGLRMAGNGLLPAAASGGRLYRLSAGLSRDTELDDDDDSAQPMMADAAPAPTSAPAPAATVASAPKTPKRAARLVKRPAMVKPRRRPPISVARRRTSTVAVADAGVAIVKKSPASSSAARSRQPAHTAAGSRQEAEMTGMMVPTSFAGPPRSIAELATASITPATENRRTRRTRKQITARLTPDVALPPPPPAPAPRKKQAHGQWAIQLAASRSERDVALQWRILQPKVLQVIAQPHVRIARARIPGRGYFHRLRLEGFAQRQRAASLCNRLKQKGVSCLVVKLP